MSNPEWLWALAAVVVYILARLLFKGKNTNQTTIKAWAYPAIIVAALGVLGYRLLQHFSLPLLLLLIGAFIIVNASMLHREIFLYKMRVLPSSVFSNTSNFSASTR